MSRFAPRSTPRVGSLSSRMRGSDASQRAMTTFCWFPPESVMIPSLDRPSLIAQQVDVPGQPALARPTGARSPGGVAPDRRQREVLAHREDTEECLVPALARHVGDPGARGGCGGAERDLPLRGHARDSSGDAAAHRAEPAGTCPGPGPRAPRARRSRPRAARSRSPARRSAAGLRWPAGRCRRSEGARRGSGRCR